MHRNINVIWPGPETVKLRRMCSHVWMFFLFLLSGFKVLRLAVQKLPRSSKAGRQEYQPLSTESAASQQFCSFIVSSGE